MNGDPRDPDGGDGDDFTPRPPTTEQLAWLRRRLTLNDRFLGYDLNRYQEMEGLSDDQLAAYLGASVDQLNRLRLTGRPREASYNADVRDIARTYEVSDFQLIRLLRSVRFGQAVAAAPIAGRLLAAARDHEGEPSDPSSDPSSAAVAEDRAAYEGTGPDDRDPDGPDREAPTRPDPTR